MSRAWNPSPRTGVMLTPPALEPNGGELPAVVLDLELSEPLPAVPAVHTDGRRVLRAWVLVRMFTEPLGAVLLEVPAAGLRPAELGAAIDARLAHVLRRRLGGLPLPIDGYTPAVEPDYLAGRRAVLACAPHITVVVCTRERPGALARCVDSLLTQQYPGFRILVVDNAPISGATAEVVRAAARRGPVEYLTEPRSGLSFARNAAVRAAPGQILAFIDDDEVADPHWLAEIARALDAYPEADVVTGRTVPAELESPAQLWFEQVAGRTAEQSFATRVSGPKAARRLPPRAAGANMTFRPGVLDRIGLFDTALGAGSPAKDAEDTLALTTVLARGGTVVHRPAALTRHYHRRDAGALRRQLAGHGTGLAAACTGLLLARPRLIWSLLRHAPRVPHPPAGRATTLDAFPRELLRAGRRGLLAGPGAYFQGRRAARAKTRLHQKS